MVHDQNIAKKREKKAKFRLKSKVKRNEKWKFLNDNIKTDLNNALLQNQVLKEALRSKRSIRKDLITSNRFCTLSKKTYIASRRQNTYEAKRSVCDFFPSMPVNLILNNVTKIKETNLKGVFGVISIV